MTTVIKRELTTPTTTHFLLVPNTDLSTLIYQYYSKIECNVCHFTLYRSIKQISTQLKDWISGLGLIIDLSFEV